MKKLNVVFVLLSITFLGVSPLLGGGPSESDRERVVEILRRVNTLEINYATTHSRHVAAEQELVKWASSSREFAEYAAALSPARTAPYRISITTSRDDSQYQVLVKPVSTDSAETCRVSGFSDNDGLIFLGNAIGCGARTAAAGR
ncbi:MAG TPA: hypothetical protein VGL89_01530 [Candidatus Koribacter sp.]